MYPCTSCGFCGSPSSKVLRLVLLGDLHCSDLSTSCTLIPSGKEGIFLQKEEFLGKGEAKLCVILIQNLYLYYLLVYSQ